MRCVIVCLLLGSAACGRSTPAPEGREAPRGLPPLEGAAASQAAAASPSSSAASPHGAAGLPPGHPAIDPGGQTDPHAGLMGGGQNPHAQPPAQIDPNAVIEGTLDVAPALKDQVKTGDVIFLSAKPVDEAGNVQQKTVAAIRLDAATFPMSFRITGANVMTEGKLEGTMMIIARVDRDGEAMTRQPGDIEGSLKVTVPAKDLKIVLDTPVAP